MIRTKAGAATLSIASNSLLIALKIAAGAITGSIAILTEAAHSSIDLVASVIALVSVRKADEPPDPQHPYGHEKAENLAAAIEGMLILIGAGIIVYEATHRLVVGAHVEHLGVGLAVIAVSAVANLAVSAYLGRRAREHRSAALEGDAAHLRADALTSIGVLVGLGLVAITGEDVFDPIAALVVAVAIVFAGLRILTGSSRVLMDEAPPPEELDRIEAAIAAARPPEMVGYHKLRARRAGVRDHIDLHVQFRSGTTLEHAHLLAHRLRDAIEAEVPDSDVLIHVEPEGAVRDPASRDAAPYRAATMVSQEARASDTSICLPSGQRQRPARPERGGGRGRRCPPDRDVAGPPWLRGPGPPGPGARRQRRPRELGERGRGIAERRRRRRRRAGEPRPCRDRGWGGVRGAPRRAGDGSGCGALHARLADDLRHASRAARSRQGRRLMRGPAG